MTLFRLIDAYTRGYITEVEYDYYINQGYSNDTPIDINLASYSEVAYSTDTILIQRDPNILMELPFSIQGTGSGGLLSAGNIAYTRCNVNGRIMGYNIFVDTSTTAVFDIYVNSTYPPTSSSSVTASAKPTITTSTHVSGVESNVSTWSRYITAGEYIALEVDSNNDAHTAYATVVIEPATSILVIV
jgi:hypothetical protein